MELPNQLKEIRQKLLADEITVAEAAKRLKELKKPNTKRSVWQLGHENLIRNTCAQCGETDDKIPMVLQQLSEPKTMAFLVKEMVKDSINAVTEKKQQWVDKRKIEGDGLTDVQIIDRGCCPDCQSILINYQTINELWQCRGLSIHKTENGDKYKVACSHSFKTPAPITELSDTQKSDVKRLNRKLWNKAGTLFDADTKLLTRMFTKQAMIESIADNERYYSLKDTVTFCKRCAHMIGYKNLLICPNCNKYKTIHHIAKCVTNSNDVLCFDGLLLFRKVQSAKSIKLW